MDDYFDRISGLFGFPSNAKINRIFKIKNFVCLFFHPTIENKIREANFIQNPVNQSR